MLDPIFDLMAGMLAWFYSLVPSYGFAIIMLTVVVLTVFAPLTYKSTKSMVAMRRLQPHVKRIQRKHAGDREKMNQEMMALYQEHSVSPLSGCLPILIQSPVFIVLFRVVRGITRRVADFGFASGDLVPGAWLASGDNEYVPKSQAPRNFNPDYLSTDSELYQALILDNEMLWLGIDLSRSPLDALGDSIGTALPYLLMIVVVAVLGWYQQRQIAGRSSGEISSQQQLIMKIIPWMLPVFSFTMPAGLVLYFIVSALLRVIQQAFITRSVYGNEELTAPLELEDDPDDIEEDDDAKPDSPLAALFSGPKPEAKPSQRHGSRRPTTTASKPKTRTRPPRDPASGNGSSAKTGSKTTKGQTGKAKPKDSKSAADPKTDAKSSGWGRAKRSAPKREEPAKPVSRRVTPKGGDAQPNRRKKK